MESTSLEETIANARISKFLDDMMPTKLFWRKRECEASYEQELWVFWSQEASTHWAFQKRIVTGLCSNPLYLRGDTLIQFWAAEMTGGRCHLTTTLQPFALTKYNLMNEKIIQHRKICIGSNFVVADDVDGENSVDGIIGRVFRNQLPEASPDLSYYSVTDYPELDLVLSCGFKSVLVLPVLEPSKQCCVGVLELLSTETIDDDPHNLFRFISLMFKNAHLETINVFRILSQIRDVFFSRVAREIKAALNKVRKLHNITLAFVWARCAHHDFSLQPSYNDYYVNCEGELLVFIPGMFFSGNDISNHCYASLYIPMKVGQGLVGKAALYRKPFLCRDVSQLSITQYPLVHTARKFELTGCFAVCLRTISTGIHEYIVELFIPRNETYIRDLHNLISSILTTLKRHLKTFEIVTQDLGNELFIEVDKFSFHKEFESFKEFPTVSTQLGFEALQNGGEFLQSDHSIDRHLENKSSCSRKDLEQHFGKKLKDAAEILGVSRSTVKRWCREHNINRWPSYKRSKVCSSSSTPKQTNHVVSRGNIEPISLAVGRDLLHSELSTNVALMSATNNITVKAAYGEKMFMFRLSYSSRMADLVDKVITRTKLDEGTFDITYLDEENDCISLACDEDLHDCLEGKTTIRMQIEPIANKLP